MNKATSTDGIPQSSRRQKKLRHPVYPAIVHTVSPKDHKHVGVDVGLVLESLLEEFLQQSESIISGYKALLPTESRITDTSTVGDAALRSISNSLDLYYPTIDIVEQEVRFAMSIRLKLTKCEQENHGSSCIPEYIGSKLVPSYPVLFDCQEGSPSTNSNINLGTLGADPLLLPCSPTPSTRTVPSGSLSQTRHLTEWTSSSAGNVEGQSETEPDAGERHASQPGECLL